MSVGWPGTSKRTPIGIDASGRFINAVQLSGSARRWRVEAAAAIPRADSTVPLDVDETTRMVGVLERQGFRGRDVILAMPNDLLLTKVLELPPATPPVPFRRSPASSSPPRTSATPRRWRWPAGTCPSPPG